MHSWYQVKVIHIMLILSLKQNINELMISEWNSISNWLLSKSSELSIIFVDNVNEQWLWINSLWKVTCEEKAGDPREDYSPEIGPFLSTNFSN